MVNNEIVLHFEVANGQFADTRIVAEALIRWVELVELAAKAIDPTDEISLEIVGNEKGSLRFPQILRFAERSIQNIDTAWSEYPYLKKAVLGSAHVFAAGVVGGLIQVSMTPDVQKVELSDDSLAKLQAMEKSVAQSQSVIGANREFYRVIERDRAIVGVGVAQNRNETPAIIVPRSEFQTRSGLWTIDEDVNNEHVTTDVWDVVLLKAPFSHKPLSWRFSRDGLPFSAQMHDAQFLAAVKDGRVPINLQEGVMMRIQIEFVERLEGQVWKADPRTRRVIRVLEPEPLTSPTPLSNDP